jgi:hypothetical protein
MNLFRDWYTNVIANWQGAFRDEAFRRYFLPNFLVCVIIYYAIIYWLNLNCGRPGLIINDPIYPLLTPRDFSPVIFFFTYSATLALLGNIALYPFLLHRGLMMFVAVFAIRALCIYYIPLSPSPGMVPLYDPVTDALGNESRIVNDLFFSGHIADLTTFFLLCRSKMLKRYILLSIFIVGTLLVWQRVHYTIDVMMAPVFAYLTYWFCVEKDFIWKSFLKRPQLENN